MVAGVEGEWETIGPVKGQDSSPFPKHTRPFLETLGVNFISVERKHPASYQGPPPDYMWRRCACVSVEAQ